MSFKITVYEKILKQLSLQEISAHNLSKILDVSRVSIHKQLKKLLAEKKIYKVGTPPVVKYFLAEKKAPKILKKLSEINIFKQLNKQYLQKFGNLSWKSFLPKNSLNLKKSFDFYQSSSAVFSAKIEGNTLNLNSFLNQSQLPPSQKTKQVKEIEDLMIAYDFARENHVNIENFLQAHKLTTKNLLSAGLQGVFRQQPVGVFGDEGLIYMAVEPAFVADNIKKLFSNIQNEIKTNNSIDNVFFVAARAHLQLAHIHPFMDGNGRMARLLEKWILAENISEKFWSLETEKFYFEFRKDYYENLNLGVNFYELNYENSFPFFSFLPIKFSN